MKAFKVIENVIVHDHDGWQHWIDESIISYHLTIEGANNKLAALLEKKMEHMRLTISLNSHMPKETWDNMIKAIETNSLNHSDDGDDCPIFEVREINLED